MLNYFLFLLSLFLLEFIKSDNAKLLFEIFWMLMDENPPLTIESLIYLHPVYLSIKSKYLWNVQ